VVNSNRYTTSNLPEDQYEPGSDGTVLRNLLGITARDAIEVNETAQLWLTQQKLIAEVTQDHRFTTADLCRIHKQWLGEIYPWAGKYREVNLSKGGFTFAMARTIPALMQEFEKEQLARYTPCLFQEMEEVTLALAEVHVELMLIHPFREGNGRLGRVLATLMALQAGLPLLDFSDLADGLREEYFAAVRAGLDRNYQPMNKLFAAVIEKTFSHLE
jgi:cell filamentation protein